MKSAKHDFSRNARSLLKLISQAFTLIRIISSDFLTNEGNEWKSVTGLRWIENVHFSAIFTDLSLNFQLDFLDCVLSKSKTLKMMKKAANAPRVTVASMMRL